MPDYNPGVVPAQDFNQLSFPVPKEYTENIPAFLEKLMDELDAVRDERSRLFADIYKPIPVARRYETKPYKSNVREETARRKQDDELSEREDSLMGQIRELRVLIPQVPPSQLGLDKTKPQPKAKVQDPDKK